MEKKIIEKLESLSDDDFIKFFRSFLDMKQYSYPDETLIKDRHNAILVLLADVSIDKIMKAIDKLKNK